MVHSDSSDSAYSDSIDSDSIYTGSQSVRSDSISSDSAYSTSICSDSCSDSISSQPPQVPETPKKRGILDEFIQVGYFYIPFMFYQQLMLLVLTSSFLFSTFGSRLPAISKCGDENFENMNSTKQCKHIEELRVSGSNCIPEFDDDFLSLPQELNYYCNAAYVVNQATTIQKLGYFFGAVIGGQLSDIFGRKKILMAGIIGMLGSFVVVSFTTELVWYSVAMFFVAVFSSYLVTVDTVYFVEMVPQKHVIWGFMFIGFSPNVIVFAGLAWISHDFRTLARVCAGITAALLVMQIWCPESARWLLQKQKLEEAKNVVKRIHKWNRTLTDLKSIQVDFAFMNKRYEIDFQMVRENEINSYSRKNFYLFHLFSTDTMAKQILGICFTYILLYFGYYKLVFNVQHLPGNVFVNIAIMGAILWLVNILYGIMDIKYCHIGRKGGTLSILLLLTVFCLGVFILKMILEGFGFSATSFDASCYIILGAVSFNGLIIAGVVAAEMIPTPVRGSAIGLIHFCGRFGMIVTMVLFYFCHPDSPETYKEGVSTFFFLFYLLFCAFVPFSKVPETNGVPLSDQMPEE